MKRAEEISPLLSTALEPASPPWDSRQDSSDNYVSLTIIIKVAVLLGIVAIFIMVVIIYHINSCVVKLLRKSIQTTPNQKVLYPRFAIVLDSEAQRATWERFLSDITQERSLIVLDPEVQGATIEKFLSNMARERPLQFFPQQLAAFTKNFCKVLGSGGFGVVYKGEFPNGVPLAVKVLKCNASERVAEQFMAEVATIGRTYHMNLVRLYGFCFHNTMRALVYEYMEFGSLDKLLFSMLKCSVAWEKLQDIAIGIAKGIAYLHEDCQQRIIHYDIKPENVLLDANLTPKVADFGLATLCSQGNTHISISGLRGTPGYAAPEMYTAYATHKCDVYSYGMLLFEIIGRRRNFDATLGRDSQHWLPRWTYNKFDRGELSDMFNIFTVPRKNREKAERMVKVALWCVQYLPKARPMMSTVVKMLEGLVEIDTPPNPFEHLEDLPFERRSNDYSNGSTTMGSSDSSFPPCGERNLSMEAPHSRMLDSQEISGMGGVNTI